MKNSISIYVKELDRNFTFTQEQFSEAFAACIIHKFMTLEDIDNIDSSYVEFTLSFDCMTDFTEDGELVCYKDNLDHVHFTYPKEFYDFDFDIDEFMYLFGNENESASIKISLSYQIYDSENIDYDFDEAYLEFRDQNLCITDLLDKDTRLYITEKAEDFGISESIYDYY